MDNIVENGTAMQELVWKVDSFDKILWHSWFCNILKF
jgi:hypothetical protein